MRSAALLVGALLVTLSYPAAVSSPGRNPARASGTAPVRVIVRTADRAGVAALVETLGGQVRHHLHQGLSAELAAEALDQVRRHPAVRAVAPDRPLRAALDRTAAAVGARWVADNLGLEGRGVGIAIIDSGVTAAHDDLDDNRVVHFVDFIHHRTEPYDGYGHGSHVAGIIAGSGYDSAGARRGIAPGAHLIVLKTLDARGDGFISDAIAAIDYAIDQRAVFDIRIINLSVAAGVYESYRTDPLTLAARRAVDAGMVVVTAAGNQGRDATGKPQHGGITSPGNAPWVLTVGAASHNGTVQPLDDTIAAFSSLGPSAIDLVVKPDLVAPGLGTESLADPGSTLYEARPRARVWGTVPTDDAPYLALSGTSMAAPVVTGTVALMLQANPALQPDAVKAILRASSSFHPHYSRFAQGAGFLNARAAVDLATRLGGSPSGARRLAALVQAFQRDAAAMAAACRAGDAACTEAASLCADGRCLSPGAGSIAGVSAAAPDTVWSAFTYPRPASPAAGHPAPASGDPGAPQ